MCSLAENTVSFLSREHLPKSKTGPKDVINLPDTPKPLRQSSTPHYRERSAFVQLSFLPVLDGLIGWCREPPRRMRN
jgi:hypothetical protein